MDKKQRMVVVSNLSCDLFLPFPIQWTTELIQNKKGQQHTYSSVTCIGSQKETEKRIVIPHHKRLVLTQPSEMSWRVFSAVRLFEQTIAVEIPRSSLPPSFCFSLFFLTQYILFIYLFFAAVLPFFMNVLLFCRRILALVSEKRSRVKCLTARPLHSLIHSSMRLAKTKTRSSLLFLCPPFLFFILVSACRVLFHRPLTQKLKLWKGDREPLGRLHHTANITNVRPCPYTRHTRTHIRHVRQHTHTHTDTATKRKQATSSESERVYECRQHSRLLPSFFLLSHSPSLFSSLPSFFFFTPSSSSLLLLPLDSLAAACVSRTTSRLCTGPNVYTRLQSILPPPLERTPCLPFSHTPPVSIVGFWLSFSILTPTPAVSAALPKLAPT